MKYKAITLGVILGLLFLLVNSSLHAQYWLQKGGGMTIDEAYDISVDASGNSYTVGYFTGMASFGPTYLNASGSSDIFITKTNSSGAYLWTKKAGSSGSDRGTSIATDASGNSYITGYFNGTANFGSVALISSGVQDIFIAKYNSAGVVQWAKKAGGTASDLGFGIAVNNLGDVFVTGSFKDSATFGSTVVVSNNTTSDVFVTKLNSAGVFQWAKTGTSTLPNLGRSLGCDDYGNVYLTGQYSDTITFDLVHNNQSQNIIFLVKLDSTGSEQWFTKIDGASSNVANDLAVDAAGNCYITGDFSGILKLYDINTGVSTNLTSPLSNTIFIAKYDSAGLWINKVVEGSDNLISSQSIAVDNSGNYYIGGNFKCVFTDYMNRYGGANFNAVGNYDVFVAKYDSSGVWAYSRNLGGRSEDLCNGIDVNATGKIHAVGTFSDSIIVPTSSRFNTSNLAMWSAVNCNGNSPYCLDNDYGNFTALISAGNGDAFMFNGFDSLRSPFDFYLRSGAICDQDRVGVCSGTFCPDSISACGSLGLKALSPFCKIIGPVVLNIWYDSLGNSSTSTVISSGTYTVFENSMDGCYSSTDSVYVDIKAIPLQPEITDGKGVNNHDTLTSVVDLCSPDTTLLTGSALDPTATYWWTGPGLGTGVYDSTVIVSVTGTYVFHVLATNGCDMVNFVLVKENPVFPPFDLEMLIDDSVTICYPDPYTVQLYDSITNPTAQPVCISTNVYTAFSTFISSPVSPYLTSCDTYSDFTPTTSGNYVISATLVRFNACERDTFDIVDSVYVTVNPKPVIAPFIIFLTGNPIFCPGESTELTASGASNYAWMGPGVWGNTDSVVTVYSPGSYLVQASVYDTNIFGCTASLTVQSSKQIFVKSQPVITASDLVICTNGTVTLWSNLGVGNAWEGPNGPIIGGQTISVTDPGQYFTVVDDADSCGLVSNTITLHQYTTPSLITMGDTFICPGDSTIIAVQASSYTSLLWQAPLSGSSLTQIISTPGTYTCEVTSCGIVTSASITVYSSAALGRINGSNILCTDSTTTLSGVPGMTSYLWMPGSLTTQSITVSNAGTFTLSVVDPKGCIASSDTFLVSEVTPQAIINGGLTTVCFEISAALYANPGMGSYLWSPTGDTTETINVNQPGNYFLAVTDTNGCVASDGPVNLFQTAGLGVITGLDTLCHDSTLVLSGQAGMSSYLWMPGNGTGVNFTVTSGGSYSLVVEDTNGCTASSVPFIVTEITVPVAINANALGFCYGDSLQLVGNAGMSSYLWSPSGETTPTIYVSEQGSYSLLVSDSFGCNATAGPMEISESQPFIDITLSGDSLICEEDSVTLTATEIGFSSYLWTPGNYSTPSITVTQSGAYNLVATDSLGCESVSDMINIEVQENDVTTPIVVNDTLVCEGMTVTLFADAGTDSVFWYEYLGDPSIAQGNSFTTTAYETFTYYVQSEDAPCFGEVVPITIITDDCNDQEINNIFSPNGDGINDRFQILIMGTTCFEVEIYNRWGKLIYVLESQTDYWSGQMKNSLEAPDGVYYYILQYCDYKHENFSKTGYITLVR